MFELLVYLFENYIETDVSADEGTLTRELSAAGFDSEDISKAFTWFSSLAAMADQATPTAAADRAAYRIYTMEESKKIGADSRSFLLFLEQANVLNPLEREVVIDRLMALPDPEVGLEQTKWIALMVLWRHGKARDYLFVEDALFSDSRPTIH
jgi:Smg protein